MSTKPENSLLMLLHATLKKKGCPDHKHWWVDRVGVYCINAWVSIYIKISINIPLGSHEHTKDIILNTPHVSYKKPSDTFIEILVVW